MFADRQARSGLSAPWSNGKNAKEYRATMGSKPVGALFSVGVEEPYRWKDSVQTAPEIRLWVLDAIANGQRPWFSKFCGTLHDKRWLPVVEELYGWHYRNERYLRNVAPMARVAMVYSQQTAHYYGGERARQKVEDHTLGYYQALIEARIPFEMVHDRLLDAAHLAAFKVLILPNIAALSDAQCGQIREFVERGGSLVATYETSLYDEWGVRRAGFRTGLAVRRLLRRRVDARMMNSYLRLESEPATGRRHPLLAGLEDAGRIINGVSRVHTRAPAEYRNPPLTLIPSYPDLPMEEVFPREPKTDIPEVYVRQAGAGRVVYFPWDIDRTFWEVLAVDHCKLLRNAVDWAADEPRPVDGRRTRSSRRDGMAAEGLHDRAPGESHQPHDDEGTAARIPSAAAATGDHPPAGRPQEPRRQAAGERADAACRAGRRTASADRSVDFGSRSNRHRPLIGAGSTIARGKALDSFPNNFRAS